jgi:hypothetical protein
MKPGMLAGLAAYGDGENALGIAVGDGKVVVWRREKNEHKTLKSAEVPPSPTIYLRLSAAGGSRYRFAVSRDGRDWKEIGDKTEGDYLPPWDRAVRVALTVGGADGAIARFESLRITPSRRG